MSRARSNAKVIVDDCFERWILQALVDHHGAPWMEAAAGRKSRRVRNGPRDDPQPIDYLAELRQRRLQSCVVRMQRPPERRSHIGILDDLPSIHHGHAMRRLRDHAEIVGDENDGHPHLALQLLEQLEYLR